jgi:hypothetical protein
LLFTGSAEAEPRSQKASVQYMLSPVAWRYAAGGIIRRGVAFVWPHWVAGFGHSSISDNTAVKAA